MGVFDILGPVMVGPSSSHTAGAVRIGYITRLILGRPPVYASVLLSGSFAATGKGHGTDKAIVAGLLGMKPDDIRIPQSLLIAEDQRVEVTFGTVSLRGEHPNTALLTVRDFGGNIAEVMASSIGGGQIIVRQINGIEANFSGESPTLIISNTDLPGRVAEVSSMLSQWGVNIASMQLCRSERGGSAVMIIETDQHISKGCIDGLKSLEGILKVTYIYTR